MSQVRFVDNSSEQLIALDILSKYLVRFPIQLIITSKNRNYSMVCISTYGSRGSFFNISCAQTLFYPEIFLLQTDSDSLILSLSSGTSQVTSTRVY